MKPRRVLIANPCVETQRLAIVLQKHGWEVISETRLDRLAQACKLHKPTVGLFRLDDVQISRLDNQVRSLLAATRIDWIAAVSRRCLDQPALQALLYDWFYDFHTLPYDPERLMVTLGRAYGRAQLFAGRQEDSQITQPVDFCDFVGQSSSLLKLKEDIRKVATTDVSVLVTGESGTGKEMVTRLLHALSPRREGPFVPVNCAAIPATLIQSELFGYEKGAFTGANQRKIGRIEAADNGTLFLDEIGDLARDLQANLLRFLQEGTIERVGAATSKAVNVRVVSATHVDLPASIREGNFREDLYYRLNVCHLHIPPLRERKDDIVLLAERFLAEFIARERLPAKRFASETIASMLAHRWPGNVRELQNRVSQGAVMSSGRLVQPADMGLASSGLEESVAWQTLDEIRGDAEREALQRALVLSRHNHSQAATQLGISRATLYRLLEKHNLSSGETPSDLKDGPPSTIS